MDQQTKTEIEAAVFRRLLTHFDNHKEVQNIDLMNLASFCRNCLSKWYVAAAEERGESVARASITSRLVKLFTASLTQTGKISTRAKQLQIRSLSTMK